MSVSFEGAEYDVERAETKEKQKPVSRTGRWRFDRLPGTRVLAKTADFL
jgi:hypothetical protein